LLFLFLKVPPLSSYICQIKEEITGYIFDTKNSKSAKKPTSFERSLAGRFSASTTRPFCIEVNWLFCSLSTGHLRANLKEYKFGE
jgi:hypothetical protein